MGYQEVPVDARCLTLRARVAIAPVGAIGLYPPQDDHDELIHFKGPL